MESQINLKTLQTQGVDHNSTHPKKKGNRHMKQAVLDITLNILTPLREKLLPGSSLPFPQPASDVNFFLSIQSLNSYRLHVCFEVTGA